MADKLPNLIELNVGGQLYTTRLATLTSDPDSMLAAMFSGRHLLEKDSQGRFFIDRDGSLFRHVLNFLRDSSLPAVEVRPAVLKEAQYFQVKALVDSLQTPSARESEDKVRTLFLSRFPKYDEVKRHLVSCAEEEACKLRRIFNLNITLLVYDEVENHPQKGVSSVRFIKRTRKLDLNTQSEKSWFDSSDVVSLELSDLGLEESELQNVNHGHLWTYMQAVGTYIASDLLNEGFNVKFHGHSCYYGYVWCRHDEKTYFSEMEVKFTFALFPFPLSMVWIDKS